MTDRPQEIRPPKVYGNFRPSLKERSKKHVSSQERREGNEEKHAALLRLLPCCVTGQTPARTIHHLKGGPAAKTRGVGMKAPHMWALPLCYEAHILGVEKVPTSREHAWFQDNGLKEPYELAAALYKGTGDLERMTKIVQAHMGRARRGR
jgi:hypothetical protein